MKRRRAPRALRFAEVKVGDILIQRDKLRGYIERGEPTAMPTANCNNRMEPMHATCWAIVTDLWLDPVLAERDETRGRMVGLRYFQNGQAVGSKWSTTLRGLASQQWNYATQEEIAEQEAKRRLIEAVRAGEAVPISRSPKARPKGPRPL